MTTLLTIKEIDKMKMSEKIRLIFNAMESICEDFQKSESHSNILEKHYPFALSLDEMSDEVFRWHEDVEENEKHIPVVQNRSNIEILHSDTFKKAMSDDNAMIFVKYFNNDRGAHVDYIFKWQDQSDVPTTFYNGITFYQTYELITHEEAIRQFITDTFKEEDAWCWIEESEFFEWMAQV